MFQTICAQGELQKFHNNSTESRYWQIPQTYPKNVERLFMCCFSMYQSQQKVSSSGCRLNFNKNRLIAQDHLSSITVLLNVPLCTFYWYVHLYCSIFLNGPSGYWSLYCLLNRTAIPLENIYYYDLARLLSSNNTITGLTLVWENALFIKHFCATSFSCFTPIRLAMHTKFSIIEC